MTPQFARATPILRMFDVRKAREFYLDFLGFKVDFAKRYGYARPGLERQPWGATTMTVTDPFYNWLVLSEENETPA